MEKEEEEEKEEKACGKVHCAFGQQKEQKKKKSSVSSLANHVRRAIFNLDGEGNTPDQQEQAHTQTSLLHTRRERGRIKPPTRSADASVAPLLLGPNAPIPPHNSTPCLHMLTLPSPHPSSEIRESSPNNSSPANHNKAEKRMKNK